MYQELCLYNLDKKAFLTSCDTQLEAKWLLLLIIQSYRFVFCLVPLFYITEF